MTNSLPMEIQKLQEKLCLLVASELPNSWQSVRIHYEHYPREEETHEMFSCSCLVSECKQDYSPSLSALDLLLEIKSAIESAGHEPWTYLDFTLASDGEYRMEFNYGIPPLVANCIAPTYLP